VAEGQGLGLVVAEAKALGSYENERPRDVTNGISVSLRSFSSGCLLPDVRGASLAGGPTANYPDPAVSS
jgi:hypothetical protein